MHPKNTLQNILQSNKQKLPIYNYIFRKDCCCCIVTFEIKLKVY